MRSLLSGDDDTIVPLWMLYPMLTPFSLAINVVLRVCHEARHSFNDGFAFVGTLNHLEVASFVVLHGGCCDVLLPILM